MTNTSKPSIGSTRTARKSAGADNRERAKFWEVWDKANQRVLWVAHGCEKILDEDDPHLDLRSYFPCPKPAYGTVQRGSLVPVPDVLQYRDQLEEINLLTGRIHALSDALEAKGFYPAGGSEIADAVQTAMATHTPGRVLVPISNWAAFGGIKEVIVWLPIDMIATTITALVALRKQVIEDIYQIMGLSDIMRGATDPQRNAGRAAAQEPVRLDPDPRQAAGAGAAGAETWSRSRWRSSARSLTKTPSSRCRRPSCRPSR